MSCRSWRELDVPASGNVGENAEFVVAEEFGYSEAHLSDGQDANGPSENKCHV